MAAGSKNYLVSIMLTAKDSASAVFQNVGGAAESASGRIQALSKSITPEISRLGTQATIAGGAIIGALGLAGNAAAKYGEQLAQIATTSDEAVGMMDEYRSGLLRLSSMYAQSTDALAQGMYDALSSGITAADALGIMEVASKTAVGGLTDVSTAVDLFTSTLNAWGESASEAAHYSDVMFATAQVGKTTIPELANSIGMVASTAAMAGVSIEDVGAAIATMTLRGIDTARAVTSLTATITSFMKPTKEMEVAIKKSGYASGEALLRAEGLTGAIKWLGKATGGSAEKMATFLGSVQAMRGASAMAANGASDLVHNLEFVTDSAGAADKAFGKISATAAFQMKRAAESTKGAAIQIGTAVAAILQPIASVVASITGWIAAHESLGKVIAIVGGVLGTFLLVTGTAVKTLELMRAASLGLAAAKTWLATVVGTATAATAAETTAVAANAAATQGAAAAAAANTVATEGMAAATVAAGATMTTVLLSVMAVLVALGIAIVSVKRTWEEFQRYRQAKKEAEFSLTSEKEMEAKREFQLSYKAEHGTTTGWMEAWEKSAEAQRLRQETEAARSKAWGSSGEAGDMASTLQALQQQAEQTQKDLATMAQSQSSQLTLPATTALPSATGEKTTAAAMAQLPPGTIIDVGGPLLKGIYDRIVDGVVNVAIASTEAVAAMPASGGSGSWSQGGSSGSGPSGYATESDIQREYQTLLEMGDYAHLSAQELRAAAEYNAATVAQFEWIKAQGINESTAWDSAIHNANVLKAEGQFSSVPVSSQTPSPSPTMQWAPLQLNIALDEGVMVTNWNTAARRRDWDLKVRAAY
jgi:TP901 family phage tail tape measure protein